MSGNMLLHIPYLSYVDPVSGPMLFWADLVYESNPTNPSLILFKLINADAITRPSDLCSEAASTITGDLKIHIPDVLLWDGITHDWLDLALDPALSTGGNIYFHLTKGGTSIPIPTVTSQYSLKGPESSICAMCHVQKPIPSDLTTYHTVSHAAYNCNICHTFSGTSGTFKPLSTTRPTSTPIGYEATISGNMLLHIPYLSYVDPVSGPTLFWADFVYESNPTYPSLILFKLINADAINNSSNLLSASLSTITGDLKIHIPDVLLWDGITHYWLDLALDPALSTGGNIYFYLTNNGLL